MGRTQRLVQPEIFGKYQLTAQLATGRMGEVYKAKSLGVEGFEKILVVKVIHPHLGRNTDFINTLIEEAKRAVSLSHANVAQVYDLGHEEAKQTFYIATEYVNGFDLERTMHITKQAGRLWPHDFSIFIASELAKGLDYAHRRKDFNFNNLNILHRSLSPRNIVLSFDGEIKLTDFGISRALDYVNITEDEDIIQRYLFAAPEVAQNQGHTRQSDIFSLGLVLYQMLSGIHPYAHVDAQQIQHYAQQAAIPSITEYVHVPRPLLQLLEAMLAPTPSNRPQSAGTVYEELISYLFGNSLKADNRLVSLFMQDLRRDEQRLQLGLATEEFGLEEISYHELQHTYALQATSIFVDTVDTGVADASELTSSRLPSVTASRLLNEHSEVVSETHPPLPGSLEVFFRSAKQGRGKAVLVSGRLGSGRHYLPDRLIDSLSWREDTHAFSIQTTVDDRFRPFGVLGDLLLQCLTSPTTTLVHRRNQALEQLSSFGVGTEAVQTLQHIWGISSTGPELGYLERQNHLTELFYTVLLALSKNGPLVLIIDRVERADTLTLDVLRDVIAQIGKVRVMLVIGTDTAETIRATFDQGHPEDLEAIAISGQDPPQLDEIEDLCDDALAIMITLAMSEHPVHQANLEGILGLNMDAFMIAAQQLADMNIIRVPRPGVFMSGMPNLMTWIERHIERHEIEAQASRLASFYTELSFHEGSYRYTPIRIRLHALAGERRQMVELASQYGTWLEQHGWLHVLLSFYKHCAGLLAHTSMGTPPLRIAYMLSRAELALELAQLDECRASLEPLSVLSETVRYESGFVRSQILLGQLAMHQDELEDAYKHFQRAADTAHGLNHPGLLTRSYLALAGWYERIGDKPMMQHMLEGAMNLSRTWESTHLDLRTKAFLAHKLIVLSLQQAQLTRARALYHDFDRLVEFSNLVTVRCRAASSKALLLATEQRFNEAIELLRQAISNAHRHGLIALRIEMLRTYTMLTMQANDMQATVSSASMLVDLARRHEDLYSEQLALDIQMTAIAISDRSQTEGCLKHLRASLARAQSRGIPGDIERCHAFISQITQKQEGVASASL